MTKIFVIKTAEKICEESRFLSSLPHEMAARDGILEVLKQTTKRDCNDKDEDGMTPTAWAAFEGNLEALRLLVARGGDPDKSDNFGNTALHHASERGHLTCVRFLTNFGANMWSLNCKMHTPKELAAMSNKGDVLRFLDEVMAEQETTKRKEVKAKKERAQKEAEKKLKEYEKVQKKAEKCAEKEQKRLEKERKKMEEKSSAVLQALKNKAGVISVPFKGNAPSPRFSEIVGTVTEANATKFGIGAVHKKIQQIKFPTQREDSLGGGDFKVVEVEDGKKSVKNLTGLRRDSEILYVGTFDKDKSNGGGRCALADVFQGKSHVHNPETCNRREINAKEQGPKPEQSSIFERPGFGSFAFRNSIKTALNALPTPQEEEIKEMKGEESSIGSAGSLAKRQMNRNNHVSRLWNLDEFPDEFCDIPDADEVDSLEYEESSPLQLFLISNGLVEYTDKFMAEKIDLESLLILTDEDLISLGLPLGPRRKLMAAVQNRKKALEEPGEVLDSQL
ncbi:hypothetical protein RUM44_011186 [Polyplax serrata]|uniref:SAM domain-containing protein n=1 Tax=Polyplax serrata TaxID=468196 RepID=A0ABR1APA5_POLSC